MNQRFALIVVVVILLASTLACRLSVGVGDQLVTNNNVRLVEEFSADPNVICTIPKGETVNVIEVSSIYIGAGSARETVVRVSHPNCSRSGWALVSHFK